ncbi:MULTISPECIES: CsbD family protein [Paraburkholderia]|uniref:CsbD family protein n=2 Tax=Paraburkholderia TaxID=1822464 RepID=A0ABU9S5K2_9BURK|nr:CsbD family protein [Paraburkholderia nodosa]
MDTRHAHAIANEVAGEAQHLAGRMLRDPAMGLAGKAKVLYGKSQQALNDAADATRDNVADKPMTALGLAAAVGFALGAAWVLNRNKSEG